MTTQTIYYVVDKFREFLRQTSDDSVYSDEFLYQILLQSRAEVIKQQLNNNKDLSPWMYQRFCIKLCPSSFIECKCLTNDFGCTFWRSENPIPEAMFDGFNTILNISELYGNKINMVTEDSFRTIQYRKYKVKFYYLIADYNGEKHMFVLGSNDTIPPRYIKAEGVFMDPSEIDDFTCDSSDCFDPNGNGFNLSLNHHNAVFKLATQLMGVSMKMPEDRSNDAESTVINQKI